MILRPRRHSEASRDAFRSDDSFPVRNFQKKKNGDKKQTIKSISRESATDGLAEVPPTQSSSEVGPSVKLLISVRPRSTRKCSQSQSSTLCSIQSRSRTETKPEKSLERFSMNDISLTNPIVLMDRYKPPKDDQVESPSSSASCSHEMLQFPPKPSSAEDLSKESETPKTPDTATASDSSTPPRKKSKQQSDDQLEGSDDDVTGNETPPTGSKWSSPEDGSSWKPKSKVKKAAKSFASTDTVGGKKKKLFQRQTTKRPHSTTDDTDRGSDAVATKLPVVKRSSTSLARSHDSGDGPRKKTKKSKLEEERQVDYYASLLWISDNISDHRKQNQNWSDFELESSLRLKWNNLKKKEKSDHLTRIQRISYLPKLEKVNSSSRMRQWKGDGKNQDLNFEMLDRPNKSFATNSDFRNEQNGNKIKNDLASHRDRDQYGLINNASSERHQYGCGFNREGSQVHEKRKEFNFKTLFTSPGAIKKQIMKLVRQKIACTHCFLNLKQFLISKLDESWERNISKTNRPEDMPHFSATQAKTTQYPFPSMGGAAQKDNFEPALIQAPSCGRMTGMAEEKRRLKRLWSGRVWKMIEDLVDLMEAEIYKRDDCHCRFKANSSDNLFFESKFENLKFGHSLPQLYVHASEEASQPREVNDDNSTEESEEARIAIEILEQWTKGRRQNSSELGEISASDERVIKEIKCALIEYSEMVLQDTKLLNEDPICLEISRILKSQNNQFINNEATIGHDNVPQNILDGDSTHNGNYNAPFLEGSYYDNVDGVFMMKTNPLISSTQFENTPEEELLKREWKMRMFHQTRFNPNFNFNQHHIHDHHHHHRHQQYHHHHHQQHHQQQQQYQWRPRYQLQLNRGAPSKPLRNPNNANNLFLDSYFCPGQRSHFIVPSAMNSRPSPAFLTIKPPALPPMPPLPPTPPPSTGSGLYHVDNEFLRACRDSEAGIHSPEKPAADDSIKRKVSADIKPNQFFLKLSVKNSKSPK